MRQRTTAVMIPPDMDPHDSTSRASKARGKVTSVLFDLLLIMLILWSARHVLHTTFGYYEDDYSLVVRGMAATWPQLLDFLQERVFGVANQGRPLQHSMVFLLSRLVGHFSDRVGAYRLAFAIVGLNAGLFYVLLRRTFDRWFAFLAGVFYVLFSADTTQTVLLHAFGLHQSLTYLLLATLAYDSNRMALSYFLILGALLSYETAYLVFIGAPFLKLELSRVWLRRLIFHVSVVMGGLLVVVGLRVATGEGRVLELSGGDLFLIPIRHMLVGPIVALGSYVLRPVEFLLRPDPVGIGYALLGLVALASYAMVALTRTSNPKIHGHATATEPLRLNLLLRVAALLAPSRTLTETEQVHARLVRHLATGVVMLVMAYPLTFTLRAHAISGRDTRVHLAAVSGAALLWAVLWYWGMSRMDSQRARIGVSLLFGAHIALMVGFGWHVQRDYQRAWELQRQLWQGIVAFTPNLEDGTRVFVQPDGLIDTRHIGANTWNMPLVFQYVYEFPEDWENPPQVHRLQEEWLTRSLTNPTELKALDMRWEYVVAPWSKVVILDTQNGHVIDRRSRVTINGEEYLVPCCWEPPASNTGLPFAPGYLFDELIGDLPMASN